MRSAPLLVLVAGLALPTCSAGVALAQCNLYRAGVPDFDQRRDGLPQGGGSVHCVPTSAINWMGYAANNGFPFAMAVSGPRDWQDNASHQHVTGRVNLMGTLMSTSLPDGTNGLNGINGLRSYLTLFSFGQFTASRWYGAVSTFDIYLQMASNGLVNVCFGYFEPMMGSGDIYYSRNGGHCTSARGIENFCDPSNTRLLLRDPATADGNDLVQSTFTTNVTRVSPQQFFTNPALTETATRLRMHDYGVNSTTRRYIDSIYVIRSTFSLWAPPSPTNTNIIISKAVVLPQDPQPQQVNIPLVTAAPALQAALHPDQTKAAIVSEIITTAGNRVNQVILVNLADGTQTDVLQFPPGRLPIAFNRFGDLFVCDGSLLRRYDISGRPVQRASRTLAAPATAIAFDDALDEVVLVTPSNRRLLRLPYGLGSAIDEPLPTGVPAMTDAFVIPDPMSPGKFILGIAGSPTIHQLSLITGSSRLQLDNGLLLPAVQDVKSLHIGDGFIQALTDAGPRTLDRDPASGRLRLAPTQPFAGLGPMRLMSLSSSRTNFDPAIHVGPAWSEVPETQQPQGVPDCRADFNGDTLLTAADIFDFLNAWFAVLPSSDINVSGQSDAADIFDFLNLWFAGC